MKSLIASLAMGLSPKQAAAVAFVGAFVTIIGALALAFWFRRKNKREGA